MLSTVPLLLKWLRIWVRRASSFVLRSDQRCYWWRRSAMVSHSQTRRVVSMWYLQRMPWTLWMVSQRDSSNRVLVRRLRFDYGLYEVLMGGMERYHCFPKYYNEFRCRFCSTWSLNFWQHQFSKLLEIGRLQIDFVRMFWVYTRIPSEIRKCLFKRIASSQSFLRPISSISHLSIKLSTDLYYRYTYTIVFGSSFGLLIPATLSNREWPFINILYSCAHVRRGSRRSHRNTTLLLISRFCISYSTITSFTNPLQLGWKQKRFFTDWTFRILGDPILQAPLAKGSLASTHQSKWRSNLTLVGPNHRCEIIVACYTPFDIDLGGLVLHCYIGGLEKSIRLG